MLDKLMVHYNMSMLFDVRSPMLHIVGPAGSGKSTTVEQLADLLGVNLHIINVSRLSPLEVEGVQMPSGSGDEMILKMLPARYWTQLQDGDIVLMDEFLRGFPEVYSALLDIFTSRRVGAFVLPKVFIIGASNSVVTYDAALEDRLLHLPVADPRKSKGERDRLSKILVDALGLMPDIAASQEMVDLLHNYVLPGFNILDTFQKTGSVVAKDEQFVSIRNLIGQAQMKCITTPGLRDLIQLNNLWAMQQSKAQYVVLITGDDAPQNYEMMALKLNGSDKLTPMQQRNIIANLQLIEFERARKYDDA